jgi:hypothetical protein
MHAYTYIGSYGTALLSIRICIYCSHLPFAVTFAFAVRCSHCHLLFAFAFAVAIRYLLFRMNCSQSLFATPYELMNYSQLLLLFAIPFRI